MTDRGSSSEPPAELGGYAKRAAGRAAAELVADGMLLGLGTGSTAQWFIDAVAVRCRDQGLRVHGVATSEASTDQARAVGIPLVELPLSGVDLAVDGADQIDPELRLVKGAGGALVRERIVASAATRFVVVADPSKVVRRITANVPLEILPFGAEHTLHSAAELMAGAVWRRDPGGVTLRSDNGNLLADARLAGAEDLEELAAQLVELPGLLGHGLFLGMADLVLVGHDDGRVTELLPSDIPESNRQ
ncbi:MAG: ribose-5-phosphate isomerase RpiA [Candidatus Dormibacteria bacterium]